MYTGQIVFSQLMDIIPKYQFRKIVADFKIDQKLKKC